MGKVLTPDGSEWEGFQWITPRNPDLPTRGPIIARVAEKLGQPLMPWQRILADVFGEYDPATSVPIYRESDESVPRQAGKTTLSLAREIDRCTCWPEPQRVTYSAQTSTDSVEKLFDDQLPVIDRSPLSRLLLPGSRGRVRQNGAEKLKWVNGSIIDVMSSREESGHGGTRDLSVLDEVWKDVDSRREQAVIPSMNTRALAQLIIQTTMGTEASLAWNPKVEAGRAGVDAGRVRSVLYAECSFPRDSDPYDPQTWRRYHPAVGHTIGLAAIAHAAETMPEDEFLRAYANWTIGVDLDAVWPQAVWRAVQDVTAKPQRPFTWAFDVHPSRASAAIVVSDGHNVEVIEHRDELGWLPERARSLHAAWGGPFAYDARGPGAPQAREIEALGVPVEPVSGGDVAAACGGFYDRVADRRCAIRPHAALDAAAAHAARKPVGDRWVWRRTPDGDVTTLYAATLSLWVAGDAAAPTYNDWASALGRT